jgi:hypothetical protein
LESWADAPEEIAALPIVETALYMTTNTPASRQLMHETSRLTHRTTQLEKQRKAGSGSPSGYPEPLFTI